MTYSSRLGLPLIVLLPSALAAQEPLDPVRATIYREASLYADCWMHGDVDCVRELTDRERLLAAGRAWDLDELFRDVGRYSNANYARIAVAEPWPPFTVDGAHFAFLPYFETRLTARGSRGLAGSTEFRAVYIGYLIGTSDDDGATWRFIRVKFGSALKSDSIDRVIPAYGDGPLPAVGFVQPNESPMGQSRWLETTERRFVAVDEAVAYALTFDIREELEGPLNFTVRYDNPADRGQPLLFSGSLEPGQRVLQWQSPPLRGFEFGESYSVAIEGSDPDTGARRFSHREVLQYMTTIDLWLDVVAKPPESYAAPAPGP